MNPATVIKILTAFTALSGQTDHVFRAPNSEDLKMKPLVELQLVDSFNSENLIPFTTAFELVSVAPSNMNKDNKLILIKLNPYACFRLAVIREGNQLFVFPPHSESCK
ncbi:hypothetical protein D915_007492 [Fasciola hepatica]|uniref:Uncharacterized protein n=1 Tax=Fasciola hepatica TaxID=6192 RepID=A0A2H1C521_FASHE|nr:hypothetical protein D915_007492 [Fasciola hepatica]